MVSDTAAMIIAEVLQAHPQDDEKALIRKSLKSFRFEKDSSGYFFVYEKTTNVALPPKPETQGKDLGNLKDSNDIYLVRELYSKARQGGGFVEYVWQKQGSGDTPKLGYATMIPGTTYWIGTGICMDNLETTIESMNDQLTSTVKKRSYYMIFTVGIIYLGVTLLSLFIISGIIKALTSINNSFRDVAEGEGDLTKRIAIKGKDEISDLAYWFNLFLEKVQLIIVDISDNSKSVDSSANELLEILSRRSQQLSEIVNRFKV